MHPQLFGFVKSWGLLLSVSFVVGIALSIRRGRPRGISRDQVVDICFAVMVSSIIGVRLLFVLTHLELYREWYRAFFLWDGGLTLHGGIILAIAAVWWMARRKGIRFLVIADVLAPGVALGIGISRLGCFLAGCCFGTPTDLPWGVYFPASCRATYLFGDQPIHPAQLYSSLAGFAICVLLILAERLPSPAGATFGRFLVVYGMARFLLEFTRYVEPEQVLFAGWSNTQWLSLVSVLVGAVLLVAVHRSREAGHA